MHRLLRTPPIRGGLPRKNGEFHTLGTELRIWTKDWWITHDEGRPTAYLCWKEVNGPSDIGIPWKADFPHANRWSRKSPHGNRNRRTHRRDESPDFTLQNEQGKTVSLKGLQKQARRLYFYPDDTSGCTKKTCGFRDIKKLEKTGPSFSGSRDSPASTKIHEWPTLLLLADEDETLCKTYGTLKMKNMYGRSYLGVAHNLRDRTGRPHQKIFPKSTRKNTPTKCSRR